MVMWINHIKSSVLHVEFSTPPMVHKEFLIPRFLLIYLLKANLLNVSGLLRKNLGWIDLWKNTRHGLLLKILSKKLVLIFLTHIHLNAHISTIRVLLTLASIHKFFVH